jgi:hypothetical protein
VPFLDEFSAPPNHSNAPPELLVQPPTPTSLSATQLHTRWTSSRHLSIGSITMHESHSEPKASILGELNPPLTRDRRSQSVPLSLNAVAITKKLVNVSDRFEAKHCAVQIRGKERSRTMSGSETTTSSHHKRHSDLIEEWLRESDDFSSKIGSPV